MFDDLFDILEDLLLLRLFRKLFDGCGCLVFLFIAVMIILIVVFIASSDSSGTQAASQAVYIEQLVNNVR